MSPLEDRIRKVPLSAPDAAWRDEIVRSAEIRLGQSWKALLWPSPLAWAALVMIWVGLAVATRMESPGVPVASAQRTAQFHIPPNSEQLRALLAQRR